VATVATLFFVPVVYSIIRGSNDDDASRGRTTEPQEEPEHSGQTV